MKAILLVILIGTVGAWYYHRSHSTHRRSESAVALAEPLAQGAGSVEPTAERETATASDSPRFRCDGRTSCPQMHSCEEATWMLQHCAGMKMDGDNDGVPCETQWCR